VVSSGSRFSSLHDSVGVPQVPGIPCTLCGHLGGQISITPLPVVKCSVILGSDGQGALYQCPNWIHDTCLGKTPNEAYESATPWQCDTCRLQPGNGGMATPKEPVRLKKRKLAAKEKDPTQLVAQRRRYVVNKSILNGFKAYVVFYSKEKLKGAATAEVGWSTKRHTPYMVAYYPVPPLTPDVLQFGQRCGRKTTGATRPQARRGTHVCHRGSARLSRGQDDHGSDSARVPTNVSF
jgi:hypothetical protein